MRVTIRREGGANLERVLKKYLQPAKVSAGIFADATNGETEEPIAPYAAANEYGAPGIPARPFMRRTVKSKGTGWVKNVAAALKAGRTPQQALQLTGMRMAEDIQATIKSNMPPPNSLETMLKKHAAEAGKGTLIDTGSMIKSINYRLDE